MRGKLARLAAAVCVAATVLGVSATPATAQAAPTERALGAANRTEISNLASDCQISGTTLTFSNTRGRANFRVFCTVSHNLTVDLVAYNSQWAPLTPPVGAQTGRVPTGSWIPAWAEATWGGSKPVAHVCVWIYRDNPPTLLLYRGCR